MTKQVITAPPDLPLGELAATLERHNVKRLPIVDFEGRLLGIVSRADLVHALAIVRPDAGVEAAATDSVLRDRIRSELTSHLLADASQINVIVRDGAVELWGNAGSRDEKKAIRVAAELVPGVRKVEDHIAIYDGRYRF